MKRKRLLPAIGIVSVTTLGIIAAGCAGVSENGKAGKGPLTLSSQVTAFFETYKGYANPLIFYVSADGTAAGAQVCDGACVGKEAAEAQAERYCLSSSRGQPCFLYARGRQVVWDFGAAPTTADNRSLPKLAEQKSAEPPAMRPIAITWEGHRDPLIGYVTNPEADGTGTLSMKSPGDRSDCKGSYVVGDAGKGTWSVACANTLTVTGTLVVGDRQSASGEGRDSLGRIVRYVLAPWE